MVLFPGPSPLVPRGWTPELVEDNKGPLVDETDDCGIRRNSTKAAVIQLVEAPSKIKSELRYRLADFIMGP
jgi:hypothetical protein